MSEAFFVWDKYYCLQHEREISLFCNHDIYRVNIFLNSLSYVRAYSIFIFLLITRKRLSYFLFSFIQECILKNPNTLRQCHKRNLQWLYFLHLKLTAKLFIWEYITSIEFFLLNGKIMDNGLRQIAPIISCIILLEWRQDIAKGAIT